MMQAHQITFGSVCSGLEAATVAWGPLGWRATWLAEIEPYACRVLAHHYPQVPNLGDMRLIPALLRNGSIFPPDVFTGGTPCQAFSIAGLRNSMRDARGNLTMTFCEIADEIDIQRAANGLLPCVIKWENVPGVLSTEDNAFGCFLAGLAGEDEALTPEACPPAGKSSRYWKWNKATGQHALSWAKSGCVIGPQRTVAWRTMDAQYFGVAQRRRRVFVVASARKGFNPVEILFEFDGVRRDTAPSRGAPQNAAAGTLCSAHGGSDVKHATAGHIQPVAYGGNNQAGPIDISTALRAHGSPHLDFESETFLVQQLAGTLQASGRAAGSATQQDAHAGMLVPIAFDSRQDPVSSTDVFGALGSSSPQAQAIAYTSEVAGTLDRNHSVKGQDAWTGKLAAVCVTGDITHTLKAEGFDASEDGTARGQPIIAFQTHGSNIEVGDISGTLGTNCDRASGTAPMVHQHMAVRRLTPRECERLQGFPDDYTLIPVKQVKRIRLVSPRDGYDYAEIDGQVWELAADGPRYKAIGNSWAIPKVAWIGQRIDAQLRKLHAMAA